MLSIHPPTFTPHHHGRRGRRYKRDRTANRNIIINKLSIVGWGNLSGCSPLTGREERERTRQRAKEREKEGEREEQEGDYATLHRWHLRLNEEVSHCCQGGAGRAIDHVVGEGGPE
jgi:hypothetical protein